MSTSSFELESLKYSSDDFNLYIASLENSENKFLLKCTENNKNISNEYNVLSNCNHNNILKLESKEKVKNKYCLVFEYFEGIFLNDYFINIDKNNLSEFIIIAIKLCEVLNYLHNKSIVHNAINNSAVLINTDTKDIKLINFNYAFFKKNNDKNINICSSIYNSPEQTNRVDISIDYRTDIYSLGIVFYELLVGFVPFNTKENDSISYNIIAKNLPLINDLNSDIPKVLSKIVNKMIQKDPLDRYDNIISLLIDLKKIHSFIDNKLPIIDFEIDTYRKDFLLGSKNLFFGREKEINSFKDSFYGEYNRNRLYIISGHSGVGKTTFVNKVLGLRDTLKSYLIDVKFENYKNSAPNKFLYDSFKKLTKKLLIKDDEILSKWKNRLIVTLGNNAKVLYEIIPELEAILGELEDISVLEPTEAKTRLDAQLFKYLQLFATEKTPLFIFLDDMQWSDNITLKWLEDALFKLKYINVIITYRDNELDKNPSLKKYLKIFNSLDIDLYNYNLQPLNEVDIKELLDSNIPLKNSNEISKIIYKKTAGNAFFVIQIIKQMQQSNIISFDENSYSWKCDINLLSQTKASSNIIEFLESRIELLTRSQIELLKIASCIGNKFKENVLKTIYDDKDNFDEYIDFYLKDEWIVEILNDEEKLYQFSHDRIHQLFYTSIKEEELKFYHKKVGDFYYNNYAQYEDYLLTYTNHYNKAKQCFIEEEKSNLLAKMNHHASLFARKNGDFEMSLKYIKNCFELFNDVTKEKNCDDLYKDYAVSEHLMVNKKNALFYYKKSLEYCVDELKKAYIYEQIVKLHTDFSEFDEAYKIGRESLSLFGVIIPRGFNFGYFIKEFFGLKIRLNKKRVEDLLSLPEAEEERFIIIIKLLSSVLKAAYQIRPELCVLVSMKLVSICLKKGDTKDAVIGFMVYGVIFQGGVLGNHSLGYRYAKLSLDMIKKYKNSVLEPEVKFVSGYFGLSWTLPASLTEQNWHESYKSGMLIGDWFHSGCAAAGIIQSMFMRGANFQLIEEQISNFEKDLTKIGVSEQLDAIKSVKQAIKNIQKKTNNNLSFNDESFNEDEYVNRLKKFSSLHFAHFYFINKMITLYIHEKYELALEISKKSRKFLKDSKGMLHSCEHFFYESLVYTQCYNSLNFKDKNIYIKRVKKSLKDFTIYAKECPENFIVRKYILSAELSRLDEDYIRAQKELLKAIEISQIYSQFNLKAIACRLLYKIFEQLDQSSFAKIYKEEYFSSFISWGASSYLNEREVRKTSINSSLNINTLIKSSEAIFKEQKLSNLLKSLIQILQENSGAQNVVIILEDELEYKIEAISINEKGSSIDVLVNKRYEECENIVQNVIKYVIRTKEPIVINDLENDPIFSKEKSVLKRGVKSVLSFPLILRSSLKGIIYLENNFLTGVFTNEKIDLLKHLSTQIAISVENAKMYKNLEQKVQSRTKDLDIKNEELEKQNLTLQEQNNKILELNKNIIKENEKRKEVEKKLQDAVKKLDELATIDSLTKLKNRRVFDETINKEISRLDRNKEPLSLIMCDIDFFKAYNDFYGHVQGDECLSNVAKILKDNIQRSSDLVTRYGGEEFAIILPNTKKEEAFFLAKNILESIVERKIIHEKSEISNFVTLSMGIATSSELDNITSKNLIKYADKALYRAKLNGRNQIR